MVVVLHRVSTRRLFLRPFTADTLDIKTHGNVFAAMAFLQGASLAEIDWSKLDIHDQAYPVIITLRFRSVRQLTKLRFIADTTSPSRRQSDRHPSP
jgi:hypothetical protein